MNGLRARSTAFRTRLREVAEAQERMLVLNQPWTHDQLHWVTGPNGPELHGAVPPPPGRRGPVTRGGWCPCHLYTR